MWGSGANLAAKNIMENNIVSHFLPEDLLLHFDISSVIELGNVHSKEMFHEIYLEEKNIVPDGYNASQYESKGFKGAVRIQDFPIRGKAVYLVIRRRRWRHKTDSKKIVQNNYKLIAEGSRLTKDLSDFLKEIGQYSSGYD